MADKATLISYIKDMRLHFLLAAAFAAALYPLDALICALSGGGGMLTTVLTVIPVLLVWLGMLTTIFLRRVHRRKPKRFHLLVWTLTAVVVLICWFVLPFPVKILRLIYGIAVGGSFYGGVRLCYISVGDMTGPYVFTGLCLWNVIICASASLLKAAFPLLPVVLILTVTMALFAVIRNRIALESVLHGRDGERWELPREIRRSNTGLMALLCGIGVTLICGYQWLARLLQWLWNGLVKGVLRLLIWLMAQNGDAPAESAAEELSVKTAPIQENSAPTWLPLLIYAILFASLLTLILYKRREILDGLLRLWRALCRWVREKLHRTYDIHANETAAYCDYVEDLLAEESSGFRSRVVFSRREWKRLYRQYRRMPENAARYRLGYGLALAWLPETLCAPSDSVEEILQKLHEQGYPPDWDAAADSYNRVRYGEQLPESADFTSLNLLLKKMYHM